MKTAKFYAYSNPQDVGYIGWIEPDDKSWIMFVGIEGEFHFYGKRDKDGGVEQ